MVDMFPHPFNGRGFTLLELMVVMVLISLMTAFTMPTLRSSLFSDQLKTTTRRLVAMISETSQEAVRTQSAHFLSFDLGQNQVWMNDGAQDESEDDVIAKRHLNIDDSVKVVDIVSVYGGKRSQGKTTIRFSKKGYVDMTLIHLRSGDGREMTLMLSPFLGVTKLFDSYIELEDEQVSFE